MRHKSRLSAPPLSGVFCGLRRKLPRPFLPQPPFYWRRITGRSGLHSSREYNELTLVLSARGVTWFACKCGRSTHIFVPSLLERLARSEICAYKKENRHKYRVPATWPLYNDWQYAPLYVLPLCWWHGIRAGWWRAPQIMPDPRLWKSVGSVDAIRMLYHGEWERAATALTLHSGLVHLTGNIFFGAFFLALLARLCGCGHAWLLTCLGGISGNLMSALIHRPGYASVGFSTALFATVGAIGGILLWRFPDRIFMPLAAALAILAMLGTEGTNTDYGAHICGLVCGGALGICEGFALKKKLPLLPQWFAGILAVLIPAFAWLYAFARM